VAVFSSNFTLYGDMSRRVMDTAARFTPDMEIYSIDEAFLRLDRMPEIFSYQKPKGAYLMFPRIELKGEQDSMTFAKKLLMDVHVSTTPGVAFKGEGHVRMSFCVPETTIDTAFDRMEEYFS